MSGKPQHPALTDREQLLRTLDRYDWRPALAGRSLGCSGATVMRWLKDLAPDVVAAKKAEGKLLAREGKSL